MQTMCKFPLCGLTALAILKLTKREMKHFRKRKMLIRTRMSIGTAKEYVLPMRPISDIQQLPSPLYWNRPKIKHNIPINVRHCLNAWQTFLNSNNYVSLECFIQLRLKPQTCVQQIKDEEWNSDDEWDSKSIHSIKDIIATAITCWGRIVSHITSEGP